MSVQGGISLPCSSSSIVLGSSGRRATGRLKLFAALTDTKWEMADEILPDCLIADCPPETAVPLLSANQNGGNRLYRYQGDHFCIVPESGWPPYSTGEWPMMLRLAVMRRQLYGRMICLVHGSLLERNGQGILLFGRGGVGKTTTMARFRAAGGICRADDIVLVSFDGNKVTANPLPTCSYYSEYGTKGLRIPFFPSVMLRQLYLLRRGAEREEIVEISRAEWMAALLQSISQHQMRGYCLLDDEQKEKYRQALGVIAAKFSELFSTCALDAHLSGDIMKTLCFEDWI